MGPKLVEACLTTRDIWLEPFRVIDGRMVGAKPTGWKNPPEPWVWE